ncbi:hypothetical protein [Streptomyces africanus]|uniref:hypothetical protein n=1 Tax=Streptomyces africanus TaxID=231024 RepID=UPI00117EFA14|nr:hypothetical protein [Streptomyces africanus]
MTGIVAAAPGMRVEAYAPKNASTTGIPAPSSVVAWAAVADPTAIGGVRVDPVFLADGRTWTPDQFWAAYGAGLELKVVPG